jgi:nucleotide-binding universal stress UspA family protein
VLLRASHPVRRPGIAYRRIVVPLIDGESETSVALAAELASEQGASIIAVVVIELPAELPLEAHMLEEEAQARRLVEEARAIAGSYGVRVRGRVVRARRSGQAIVAEIESQQADLVVLRTKPGRRTRLFGNTAEYVLKHASCRVLVDAPSSQA